MKKLKSVNFGHEYKNGPEKMFADMARKNGWKVTKRGYPDFICYKHGKVVLVEVKPSQNHRLKLGQWIFMNSVKQYGIKCYKWSPDSTWEME